MTNKPVTIFLLILVAVLTVSSSYLFTKTKNTSPGNNAQDIASNSSPNQPVADTESDKTAQTATTDNSQISDPSQSSSGGSSGASATSANDGEASPLVNKNRASNPNIAHLVSTGETLYPIGLKYNLDWNLIARANGLTDANNVKAGTILVIPAYDSDSKKLTINYKTDQTQADLLQKNISQGKDLWRQDPVEVAKKESFPCFGLSVSDSFTLGSRNDDKGFAQVSAVKNNISYEIGLVEPSTKGSDGIWTISYVKEI